MSKLGDKAAFPCHTACNVTGMTLREYYAGLAMQSILSNSSLPFDLLEDKVLVSKSAITYADALIAELEK